MLIIVSLFLQAKLQTLEVDYARGEANLYSDSSSGESSEEEDDQEVTGAYYLCFSLLTDVALFFIFLNFILFIFIA